MDSVNKFLQETEGGGFGQFFEVSEKARGLKHMEFRVYLSAFSHAGTEVIAQALDQALVLGVNLWFRPYSPLGLLLPAMVSFLVKEEWD